MKAKLNISEICGGGKSIEHGYHRSLANKLFLTLIFGLFLLSGLNAQSIMSLENGLQTLDSSEATHLKSLVTNIHSSVTLSQGELTTYGTGSPIVTICDAGSVNMLYGDDPAFSQIELIRITINSSNELPSAIDLTQMQGFTNLKYLLVVFAYDACGGRTDECLVSKLNGIIQGTASQVIVLHKLSIPE